MKLLIALTAGGAIFLVCAALAMTLMTKAPADTVRKRLLSLQDEQDAARRLLLGEAEEQSFWRRFAAGSKAYAQALLKDVTPERLYAVAVSKTSASGGYWGVEAFIAYWLTMAAAMGCLSLLYALLHAVEFWQGATIFLLGTALGCYLPIVLVNIRIAGRRKLVLQQLPDMLDLLCVSVQAGLSLDAALRRVADKMKGPLIEECARMLQELRFGMVRRQALERLAERCGVHEVALFVAAVIQADKLGVSLANVLVIQSDNMREMRRQSVRKQAQEAPIKMLLPLALFIFPAMFVVTLIPALLKLIEGFKGFGP